MAPKSRPSPSTSATLFSVGTKKRGNDGAMWVVTVSRNDVKRWVRVQTGKKTKEKEQAQKRVLIVDNGDTPFVVYLSSLDGPGVAIVMVVDEEKYERLVEEPDKRNNRDDAKWLKPWRTFKYERALVGYDPEEHKKPKKSLFSLFSSMSSKPWWYGGNTVLLDIGRSTYVHISQQITQFKTLGGERIEAYVSVMGNSSVPYPHALGPQNTYVLMGAQKSAVIPNAFMDKLREGCRRTQNKCEDVFRLFAWVDDDGSIMSTKRMNVVDKERLERYGMRRLCAMKVLHERP